MAEEKMCSIQDLINKGYSFSDTNGNEAQDIISQLGGNNSCLTVNEFDLYAKKSGYYCAIMDTRNTNQLFPYNSIEESLIHVDNPTITIEGVNVFGKYAGVYNSLNTEEEYWHAENKPQLICVLNKKLSSPVTIQIVGTVTGNTNKNMTLTFTVGTGATMSRQYIEGDIISQYTGSTIVPDGYRFSTDAFSTGLTSSITGDNPENVEIVYSNNEQIINWACNYTYNADFTKLCDIYDPTPAAIVSIDGNKILNVPVGTYTGEHVTNDFYNSMKILKKGARLSDCLGSYTNCSWEVARKENLTRTTGRVDNYTVKMSSGTQVAAWNMVSAGSVNGAGTGMFYHTTNTIYSDTISVSNKIENTFTGVELSITLT